MLLMPPELVNRHIAALPFSDIATVDAIEELSRRMDNGFLATLEHLTNIGKLTESVRQAKLGASCRVQVPVRERS